MPDCFGCKVVHSVDHVVLFCTEEDEHNCPGYDVPHLGGEMECRLVGRCKHCDTVTILQSVPFVPTQQEDPKFIRTPRGDIIVDPRLAFISN
ncbi:MAG TPA: hypothetical protein VMR34_00135 [Candidatus Saccharimonadales bacterium]|nr:hypothetical protein [Candidatus Saccharimonadales bacterium]